MASLNVQRDVAEAQAKVLSTGLEHADINIVGGESVFFDRLIGAISLGKGVDGFVNHSDVASTIAEPWLNGSSSFFDDIAGLLGSVDTDDLKNLTVSALLMQLINKGGPNRGKLEQLLETAQNLGFADQPVAALTGSKQ